MHAFKETMYNGHTRRLRKSRSQNYTVTLNQGKGIQERFDSGAIKVMTKWNLDQKGYSAYLSSVSESFFMNNASFEDKLDEPQPVAI